MGGDIGKNHVYTTNEPFIYKKYKKINRNDYINKYYISTVQIKVYTIHCF